MYQKTLTKRIMKTLLLQSTSRWLITILSLCGTADEEREIMYGLPSLDDDKVVLIDPKYKKRKGKKGDNTNEKNKKGTTHRS